MLGFTALYGKNEPGYNSGQDLHGPVRRGTDGHHDREAILSIETLSDVPLFAARPSRYVAPKRKVATWIAVGIVHLLLLGILLFSQTFPSLLRAHGGEHETILDLTGSRDSNQPEVKMVVPQAPVGVPPEILQAPVPVIPPPEEPVVPQQQQGGGSQEKGDILGAIGREVACSAGHFENLNNPQRARCERAPFQGIQLPNGALVMIPPQDFNRFAPPPPKEARISGQDAQRVQMQRASPCPQILNMPCLNQIPGLNDH